MVDFANKLELRNKKYQANGTVIDKDYKGKFLITMNKFVSFGIDCQPIYFIPARLLKDNIYGVRVPKFQPY